MTWRWQTTLRGARKSVLRWCYEFLGFRKHSETQNKWPSRKHPNTVKKRTATALSATFWWAFWCIRVLPWFSLFLLVDDPAFQLLRCNICHSFWFILPDSYYQLGAIGMPVVDKVARWTGVWRPLFFSRSGLHGSTQSQQQIPACYEHVWNDFDIHFDEFWIVLAYRGKCWGWFLPWGSDHKMAISKIYNQKNQSAESRSESFVSNSPHASSRNVSRVK